MKKLYLLSLLVLVISLNAVAQVAPDIVGGSDTNISDVPWQVLLEINGQDACGGSIIAGNWVLTAAHCVTNRNGSLKSPSELKVYAGISLRSQKSAGQVRNVVQIIRHENYNDNPNSAYDNDIALLQLSSPLVLNSNVQAIDYATPADVDAGWINPGNLATVSGWGTLSSGGIAPNHLQSVEVPIVNNATAAIQYNPRPEPMDITVNMLAAGNVNLGQEDACQGDSGGPLVVQDGMGREILAGIVSFGIGCAHPNFLGIYTRVSQYCGWIAQHTNSSSISGTSLLCTSNNTFSIQNLPPNTAVNWSVSPAHLFAVDNGTGNTFATRATSSSTSGQGTITATLNGPCGSITLPPKSIWVGVPPRPNNISGPSFALPNQVYSFSVSEIAGATSYRWFIPTEFRLAGWSCVSTCSTSRYASMRAGTKSSYVSVYAVNACGNSLPGNKEVFVQQENCPPGGCEEPFRIYPNPSVGHVNFELSDSIYNEKLKDGYQIKIYNQFQDLVFEKSLSKKHMELNTSNFPTGLYIINIIYREGVIQNQLIIE